LFAYCVEVLRLSEHETYNRIEAARTVSRFPVIRGRAAALEAHAEPCSLNSVRNEQPAIAERAPAG
jgi:hypothetical protein